MNHNLPENIIKKKQSVISRLGLNALLSLIPVALVLRYTDAEPAWIFVCTGLSIIPLSKIMVSVTETLADYLGPSLGGLLNATLGNAPELIISFFALKAGLINMVKASISGSIIGNLLFGLGIAVLSTIRNREWGKENKFDISAAKIHSNLLLLAMFGLIIPAVFNFSASSEREISMEISIILIVIYLLTILFTFVPDQPKNESDDALEIVRVQDNHKPLKDKYTIYKNVTTLVLVTIVLAFMSEMMSDAIEPATQQWGLSHAFVGVFILALLGNTAESVAAVEFARKGKLDLSIGILLGGSAQMALMVAPTLVILGYFMGIQMNLLFSVYDLVAVIMTVTAVTNFLSTGHIKPRTGVALLALYVMVGVGFYNSPI